MIQITDNTLTGFDGRLPSKEQLFRFCELLFIIGVDYIELTEAIYEKLEHSLPVGNYILHLHDMDNTASYPQFSKFSSHLEGDSNKVMMDIQMNDTRELVKLRSIHDFRKIRIIGLDDLLCTSYEKILYEVIRTKPNSYINFCPENNYSCASALAVLWVLNYGKDITTSFAGYKNNAATEEVLLTLRLVIRHKPNRDLTVLPELTSLFEQCSGMKIGNKKPVIGKKIFQVEAGIHADGINKNPSTYEAYDPASVGGKREIVIGKHSGLKAIILKMAQMKIPVPNDIITKKILDRVKEVCTENSKSLSDIEFVHLVKEVAANERKKAYC